MTYDAKSPQSQTSVKQPRRMSSDNGATQKIPDIPTRSSTPTQSPNSPSSKKIARASSGEQRAPIITSTRDFQGDHSVLSVGSSANSSSSDDSDGDESMTFTEAQFGVATGTTRESFMSDNDDESVYSRLSQDSFSIDDDDDLDTTQ